MDIAPVSGHPFEVLLLGPPVIRWQGGLFNLGGRQNRLLVYYLAASRLLIERRSLENLLWPVEEQTDIGRQIRQALSRLRRTLPDRCLLVESNDQISLDWTRVYCDVGVFQTLLSKCLRQTENMQRSVPIPDLDTVELMRQAVSLWNGTKLLQNIDLSGVPGLEEWFIQQEHMLESGRRWLLERLSDHESASHRPLEALKLVQTALVGNELDENLHERILKLLLRTGQHSQARRHYKRMLKGFERVGTQPNQALAEFGAQLASRNYVQKLSPATTSPNPGMYPGEDGNASEKDQGWSVFKSGDEPFIGRMIILDTLVQTAQRGGGVLVYGESGQGKTRLLKEFYGHLAPPPRLILAAAQPGDENLPYQPLITALNRQVTPTEWLQLPAPWASHLSILFPELQALRTGLRSPNTENPDLLRLHIYRALSELLMLLAERQPDKRLVLVLDDAHWVDEETLQALLYLHSHAPFNQRSLMVLAARIEDQNPTLSAFAQNLRKNERFDILKMHNLSPPAVAQLVRHYVHEEPPADFLRQLVKATGGNPLYVIEIMRSLYMSGKLFTPEYSEALHESLPLPDTLLTLMQYRLSGLSTEARRLLEMIAILGDEVDPHRLHRLAVQMNRENILVAMDQLIQSGLFTQNDVTSLTEPRTLFTFTHDKFREAALRSLPAGQRSQLHLEAASFLEKESGPRISDQATRIAWHYEAGGDLPAAFRYWVWAAQQSMRLSARDTAMQHYKHCDSILESCIDEVGDEDLYLLYRSWTDSLNTNNDPLAMEKLSTRLNELGTRFNRPILLGLSLHNKTVAAFTRNEIESGLELVERYLHFMEYSKLPQALAEVYNKKGVLLYMDGQINASLEALYKSQQILQSLPHKDSSVDEQILSNEFEIGFVETLGGRPITGYTHACAALNALDKMVMPSVLTFSCGSAALASYFMGNSRQGWRLCQEGLSLAYENHAMRAIGYLNLYAGMCQAAMGELDASLSSIQIAEEFGRRFERREIYSFANRIRGDIFFHLGEFEQAAAFQRLAYAENSDLFASADYQIRTIIAQLLATEDPNSDTCQALRKEMQQIKAQTQEKGLNVVVQLANQYELHELARAQDWVKLRAVVSAQEQELKSNGNLPAWYSAYQFLIQADHAEGNHTQALMRVAEIADWANKGSNLWFTIMAMRLQIKIEKALNQPPPAVLTEQLNKLLAQLQEHSQHELVSAAVNGFRSRIEQEFTHP